MKLEEALRVANEVYYRLKPYCEKIIVAGSIRRQKAEVRDIDIVLIPNNPGKLSQEIDRLGPPIMDGEKLRRFEYNGTQVDLYYATQETWATLLLIRTGSKENNIRLCSRARRLGMKLKANGDGIIGKDGQLIQIESEQQIYEILGLKYQEPWERR
jgi:DNA polymerase/3'-5' exonuclease PolX